MSDTQTPTPLPGALWLALLAPTAIVVAVEASRELGGPALPVALPTLALLWALTTLPLVALAVGYRRAVRAARGEGAPPGVEEALAAVARAEALAAQAADAHARAEAVLRERAAAGEPAARSAARRGLLLGATIGIVLALGATSFGGVFLGGERAPESVHWHVAFAVFAEGERIAFDDPSFDVSVRQLPRAHLHVGDGYPGVLHLEGAPGATLAEALRDAAGVEVAEHALALDAPAHGGKRYEENATHRLRLLVAAGGAGFVEVKPVASYVPQDGDRLLLSFGAQRGEALAAQAAAVPTRLPP